MAQDKATLCWRCANACGGCSWSADFYPVKGWTARPTIIKADASETWHHDVKSYIVIKCPLFKDDEYQYKPNDRIGPPPKSHRGDSHKSMARRSLEALPHEELERLIQKMPYNHDIARMAFIEKHTAPQIAYYLHRCEDTIRKLICEMVWTLTEARYET